MVFPFLRAEKSVRISFVRAYEKEKKGCIEVEIDIILLEFRLQLF
jgi:hypothetical protein